MTAVLMPALGVAMTEGVVLRWLKRPGDHVAEGEPLVEIETDKSAVEVPSPTSGIVGALLAAEGDVVATGVVIAHVSDGEDAASIVVATAEAGPRAAAPLGSVPAPLAPAPLAPAPAAPAPVPPAPSAITKAPTASERKPHGRSPRERRQARERAAEGIDGERLVGDSTAAQAPPSAAAGAGEQLLPIDVGGIDPARLRDWLRGMVLIRDFESRLDALSMAGKIPGGLHLSIGQEAVAIGIAAGLEPDDLLACAHRSHHHAIAKGLATDAMMAELFGKATGCRGGRGGTMHLADMSVGFLGGNGIVGAGLGIAMGAALGAHLRGSGQVTVGVFGDGGANTGRTWESVNIASVWRLPLIVVCENNQYAVETATARLTGGGSIAKRAEGFGLPVVTVDGQDVAAMYGATRDARARAAAGDGPTFIEARTYRYEGHSTGQVINYRTIDEVRAWRETRDPIGRLRIALDAIGELTDERFDVLVAGVRAQVDAAIAFAEASPLPDPEDATRDVTGLDLGMGIR